MIDFHGDLTALSKLPHDFKHAVLAAKKWDHVRTICMIGADKQEEDDKLDEAFWLRGAARCLACHSTPSRQGDHGITALRFDPGGNLRFISHFGVCVFVSANNYHKIGWNEQLFNSDIYADIARDGSHALIKRWQTRGRDAQLWKFDFVNRAAVPLRLGETTHSGPVKTIDQEWFLNLGFYAVNHQNFDSMRKIAKMTSKQHPRIVGPAAVAPNGKEAMVVWTSSDDQYGGTMEFDLKQQKLFEVANTSWRSLWISVAYSQTSDFYALVNKRNFVEIISSRQNTKPSYQNFNTGTDHNIDKICFSPCDRFLALTDTTKKEVVIMRIHQQEVVAVLPGHLAKIAELDWSTCGNYLATGDEHGKVRIWDMQSLG